jgi:hypothetical protein
MPVEQGSVTQGQVPCPRVGCRLYSALLDQEVWLASDEGMAAELEADSSGIPVLTFAEVPHLEGKPAELLRAVLGVKAIFRDA